MNASRDPGSGCLPKILIGCGLLAVLGVSAVVGGCLWLKQPGAQIETARIVGAESVGAATIEDLAADEGVEALMVSFMREMESLDRRNLPSWFPRKRRSVEDMAPMLPTSIAVSLEEIEGQGRPAVLAAINFRGWIRFFRFMFERFDGDAEIIEYRGQRLIRLEGGDFHVAFHEGTVLVSDHVDALRRAVDRILDGSGASSMSTPLPPGTLPDGDWDATGGLANDSGRLDALFEDLADLETGSLDLGPGAAVGFGLDVESAERARGRVQVVGVAGADSDAAAERLADFARSIESRLGRYVDVRATTRVEADSAVLDLEILGLEDALVEAVGRLGDVTDSFTGRKRPRIDPPPAEDPGGP